jgi:hypothetical protein
MVEIFKPFYDNEHLKTEPYYYKNKVIYRVLREIIYNVSSIKILFFLACFLPREYRNDNFLLLTDIEN